MGAGPHGMGPHGMGPHGMGPHGMGPYGMGPGDPQLASEANTWLIVNAVIAFLCCLPLGGIGAYMASQAKEMAQRGQVFEARSKLGTAKVLGIIGIPCGILVTALWVAAQM